MYYMWSNAANFSASLQVNTQVADVTPVFVKDIGSTAVLHILCLSRLILLGFYRKSGSNAVYDFFIS